MNGARVDRAEEARVFDLTGRAGDALGRVVRSGDSQPYGSVAKGDARRILKTYAGVRPA